MHIHKRIAALITCALCLFSGSAMADLKEGDKSGDVIKLQTRLIELNFLPSDTELSKHYGSLTKAGVEAFQKLSGIKATGILDSKTEKAIYNKKAKKAKKPVEAAYSKNSADATKAASTPADATPSENIVLTNDISLLDAYPELQNNPNILKDNPGLAEQLLARQAALNALNSTNNSNSAASASSQTNIPAVTPSIPSGNGIEAVIQFGLTLLGAPYKNGGRGPDSFDCSGFVCYILGQFGYARPGSSQDISDYESWITISDANQLMRGDIVLFHTTGRGVSVGHSGIYLGDGTFLHAEPSKGVVITPMFDYNSKGEKTYYHKNYLWAKRIP